MKHYTTIQNLLDCGLCTEQELIQARAKHVLEGGSKLPVPTIKKHIQTDYHEYEDITSKYYRFYLEVDRLVYKEHIKHVE